MKNLVLYSLALLFCFNAMAQERSQYGNNTLSFSPLQINNPGIGFGVSYEVDLDRRGIVALYLPMSFSISNTTRDKHIGYYSSEPYYTGFIMPGLKFYPTGSKGKVKYAVGPNLAVIAGERPSYTYNYLASSYPTGIYSTQTRFSLGTMVFNSLNINPTPHLNIGVEMGMGVCYIDQTAGISSGMMPFLFQLGTKIGYRF
jgi:hypothetical protein